MKKACCLFFLVFFIACTGEDSSNKEEDSTIKNPLGSCDFECKKACCLGCKATEGDLKCIVLEDGSMPCCIPVDL